MLAEKYQGPCLECVFGGAHGKYLWSLMEDDISETLGPVKGQQHVLYQNSVKPQSLIHER